MLGFNLVFEVPSLPLALWAAAAAGLLWELVALTIWAFRRHPPGRAVAVTVGAVAAGPLLAVAALVWGGMTTPAKQPLRGKPLALAALRGTLIVLGASLLVMIGGGQRGGVDPMGRPLADLPSIPILILAPLAAVWSLRGYARTTAPVQPFWKRLLLGLRFAAIALLAVYMLRPTLTSLHRDELRGTVLVGIDVSRSMERRDALDPDLDPAAAATAPRLPRRVAVESQLRRNRDALAQLAQRADVRVFTFAAETFPFLDLPGHLPAALLLPQATGSTTALGDAAHAAFDSALDDGRDVAAVVLVSDGCNNATERVAPENFAAVLASRNVPLYTLAVGSAQVTPATHTLNVRDLAVPEEVDAFRRLPIAATIEALGLADSQLKVTCRFGEEVVGEETVTVDSDEFRRPLRWVHVPIRTGYHRVNVTVEYVGTPPEDLVGERSASELVHVVERDLRILYVEGKIRYEVKFITQGLAAGQRFNLDRRILLADASVQDNGLSEKLEDWLAYHAILFGDVPASRFTPRQLEIVKELVQEYGKGFGMIGGQESFGGGGWAQTPLIDVLPVNLHSSRGHLDSPVKVVPTPDGQDSDLLRVGEDGQSIPDAWKGLRELPGANRLADPKPAATVLAVTPANHPLIVSQPCGKGRSLAVAFDTTYKWVLSPDDTAERQRRFWRQVALYLCNPKGNVWIHTEKTRYEYRRLARGAEAVQVTAGVEDPSGGPLPDAPVLVTLAREGAEPQRIGGAGEVPRAFGGATLLGSQIPAPGTYVLTITADVEGRTLVGEHRFEVIERDLEALEVLANHELLQRMAAETPGRFAELAGLSKVLEDVVAAAEPKSVERTETREVTASLRWPILLGVLALLCAEWSIRKRKGLV